MNENDGGMKARDIIIFIIAVVLAYFLIKFVSEMAGIIIFLVVAYVLYLFLKKVL